jgi:hypothetical protein
MANDSIVLEFYSRKNLRTDASIIKLFKRIIEFGPPLIPKKYNLGKTTNNRFKKFNYDEAIEKVRSLVNSEEQNILCFNTFSDEDDYSLNIHISLRSTKAVNRFGNDALPNVINIDLDTKFFESEEFVSRYLELAKNVYDLISPIYGMAHTGNDKRALYDQERWLGKIYGTAGFFMVYWANFLSPEGVSMQGGWDRISKAPVYRVEKLSDGGAFLLLAPSPLRPESDEFRSKQNELLSFFGLPIIDEAYFEKTKDQFDRFSSRKPENSNKTTSAKTDEKPFVYDKAKYHYEGNFPEKLDDEQAYVHTGLFLGWLIENDLISESFKKEYNIEIDLFKARKKTGPKVFESTSGSLVDDMLTSQGNDFAGYYFKFDPNGNFIKDYMELLASDLPSIFHVKDTWSNYDKIKKRFDQRFSDWKKDREVRH